MPAPNTFTGATLDRAEDGRRRDADWVAEQRRHPRARAVVLTDAGMRVEGGALELVPLAESPAPESPFLLGLDEGGPLFAVDGGPAPDPGTPPAFLGAGGRRGEPAPPAPGQIGLREAGQVLRQADSGLAAYAAALLNWHRSHRFCANCAEPTAVGEAGVLRRCPRCALEHHPRVDPVVIMLVTDGDRLLLGRQAVWPARRYSALAGFVAQGESLEEAIVREVREEVGVEIGPPRYRSSQPWPFPASLMLGFFAPYAEGAVAGRDAELEHAAWFERAEVEEAAHEDSWDDPPPGDGLLLPPSASIARRLVEAWLEEADEPPGGDGR